jgi:hypothetical protein
MKVGHLFFPEFLAFNYPLICLWFVSEAVSSSGYAGGMTKEWCIGKDVEGNGCG